MRRLVLLFAACALTVGSEVVSTAAPSKYCNLVVDERGDDNVAFEPGGATSSSSLDIVSADVASDRQNLTAVVRVPRLESLDLTSPSGAAYSVTFSSEKSRFELVASRHPDGELFQLWVITSSVGSGDGGASSATGRVLIGGAFDEDASEVRITAPLKAFRPYASISPGTPIEAIQVVTYREVGNSEDTGAPEPIPGHAGAFNDADSASSKAKYPAGSASCVAVGY